MSYQLESHEKENLPLHKNVCKGKRDRKPGSGKGKRLFCTLVSEAHRQVSSMSHTEEVEKRLTINKIITLGKALEEARKYKDEHWIDARHKTVVENMVLCSHHRNL